MKTVQLLQRDRLGKINWEDLIWNGSIYQTKRSLNEIKKVLDYYNINYIDIRLV